MTVNWQETTLNWWTWWTWWLLGWQWKLHCVLQTQNLLTHLHATTIGHDGHDQSNIPNACCGLHSALILEFLCYIVFFSAQSCHTWWNFIDSHLRWSAAAASTVPITAMLVITMMVPLKKGYGVRVEWCREGWREVTPLEIHQPWSIVPDQNWDAWSTTLMMILIPPPPRGRGSTPGTIHWRHHHRRLHQLWWWYLHLDLHHHCQAPFGLQLRPLLWQLEVKMRETLKMITVTLTKTMMTMTTVEMAMVMTVEPMKCHQFKILPIHLHVLRLKANLFLIGMFKTHGRIASSLEAEAVHGFIWG